MKSRRIFLGIGSNEGDRFSKLQYAVTSLPDVVGVSPVYETESVDVKHGEAPHLNAVVELDSVVAPHELLEIVRTIEAAAGRDRKRDNGPCALDIDILLIDDEVLESNDLSVPHPRMWTRRFVLQPLADVAPELVTSKLLNDAVGDVQHFDMRLGAP